MTELVGYADLGAAVVAGVAAGLVFFRLYLRWTRRTLSTREREHIGLDSQLALAADIQRHQLPPVAAASTGLLWRARLEQAGQIGGDLYDVVGRGSGCWLVLVGDVSGKGIPAALVLGSIRTMFRMLSQQTDDPGEIVEKMSQALYDDTGGMPYLTCVVVRIDLQRGEIAYVNAGHPPGIVMDARRVEQGRGLLDSTGPPAGLFPGQKYEARSLCLVPGAIAILVTDGITEAFEKLGLAHEDSVTAVVAHLPHPLALDRICDALIERTDAAAADDEEEWQDDRTVVTFALQA